MPDICERCERNITDENAVAEGVEELHLPVRRSEPALREALTRHARYLRAHARQLAWHDRDLRDDLEQEGRIALWRMNPVRLAVARNPDGYQRTAIRNAMLRHLRTLSRQDPAERRIDWRIVEDVRETYGERRQGGRQAA